MLITETPTDTTYQAMSEEDCQDLANQLEYLAIKSVLTSSERTLVLHATHAIKDQIQREAKDVGVGAGRGRLTPKELLSEAERVLLRSAGGLSLLERLRRDPQLREEMQSLLREFTDTAVELDQL